MAGIWKCRCGWRARVCACLEVPVAYRRRLGGQSKVAGSLRGSVKAGAENHLDLRARGDGARARTRFLTRYIATLRKKPSTLPRKSVGGLLDRLRRRRDGIRRALHIRDGGRDPLQNGNHRFRARCRRRDVAGNLAGGRVLLFDRRRDRRGELLDFLDAAADAADGANRALRRGLAPRRSAWR